MGKQTTLQEAIQLFDMRQYERAHDAFKTLSKNDDPVALYYLGFLHYYGLSVKPNPKAALSYFQKSSKQANAASTHMLGVCYEEGIAVEENLKQAIEYYQAAFHQGYVDSGIRLAQIHESKNTEADTKSALEYYVECAKKDHPTALFKIGMAYLEGKGLKKSVESAHMWLNKALDKGSVEAMNQFRLIGAKSSSDVRTREQLFLLAKELYYSGKFAESAPYFEITAKEGILEAIRYLYEMSRDGKGVPKDDQKAMNYLLRLGKAENVDALIEIAGRYERGDGVESSYLMAESFYEKALAMGSEIAKKKLIELRGDFDA